MKPFAYLILILCSLFFAGSGPPVTIDGKTQLQGPVRVIDGVETVVHGVVQTVVGSTSGDVTLYVRTTGSDANDCLSESKACATIQEAVDRIPKLVADSVIVDVGEGTFAGFEVYGRIITGLLWIRGTLGTPTLTTGTTSGTATSGDNWTCTDSGQSWTVSELQGMLVNVGGDELYIHDNTATELDLGGWLSSSCSGKAYSIQENKTVLDSTATGAYKTNAIVAAGGNLVISHGEGVDAGKVIDSFFVNPSSKTYGVALLYDGGSTVKRVRVKNPSYSIVIQSGYQDTNLQDVRVENGSTGVYVMRAKIRNLTQIDADTFSGSGVYIHSTSPNALKSARVSNASQAGVVGTSSDGHMNFDYLRISDCKNGVVLNGVTWTDFDGSEIFDCTEYGILVGKYEGWKSNVAFVDMEGSHNIHGNTLGGILVTGGSQIRLTSTIGTGNGGFGIRLETGGQVVVSSGTSVTGSSGDATINEAETVLTWSTDFAGDGDTAVNLSTGSWIKRED